MTHKKKRKVVIFGYNDLALLAADYLQSSDEYEFVGFCVDDPTKLHALNVGSVTDVKTILSSYSKDNLSVYSAIGYKSFYDRERCFNRWKERGFQLVTHVCEGANVHESVRLGINTLVMPNTVLEKGVVIGDNVTIWSSSTVCHDAQIGDHSFIAANSTIGGHVYVGRSCFLGFSSTIVNDKRLGDSSLLGAMSLLIEDGGEYKKYLGVPARVSGEFDSKGVIL